MGSGIAYYEISTDGEHYQRIEGNHQTTKEDGEHTYYVRSVDKKGNTGEARQYKIKIDTEVPSCSLKVKTGTLGKEEWYTSDIEIDFENITENVSEIFNKEIDKPNITENTTGTKITGTIVDLAGNKNTCSINVKLDETTPSAPIITPSDRIESGKWHGADFYLSLSGASNISGNIYYYGTTDNPITVGTQINHSSNTTGVTYYAKVCSTAGLCSENSSYTVKFDKTKPTSPTVKASDNIESGNWHQNDFDVTCSVNGTSTSNLKCYYGTDPNNMKPGDKGSIKDNTAGQNHYFKVCNEAMVCSDTVTYQSKLDETNPTISAKSNPSYIQQNVSKAVTDYFNVGYSVSGGSVECKLGNQVITNINQLNLGVNTLTCVVTSGNNRTASTTITFRHQYNASLACTDGRTLTNGNCTQYYANNEAQCGCNSYNSSEDPSCPGTPTYQSCQHASFGQTCTCEKRGSCKQWAIKQEGQNTFDQSASFETEKNAWCYGWDKCECWTEMKKQVCRRIKYDYSLCLDYYWNSASGSSCDSGTIRNKSCTDNWGTGSVCPVEHYPSCQLPKFGCNVANSCTKTENQYLTYQCNQTGNTGTNGSNNNGTSSVCTF